jgi:hypothetical protein
MFADLFTYRTTNFVVRYCRWYEARHSCAEYIEYTPLLAYERPTTFVSSVSHPTSSALTSGRGIYRPSMCIFPMRGSPRIDPTTTNYLIVFLVQGPKSQLQAIKMTVARLLREFHVGRGRGCQVSTGRVDTYIRLRIMLDNRRVRHHYG